MGPTMPRKKNFLPRGIRVIESEISSPSDCPATSIPLKSGPNNQKEKERLEKEKLMPTCYVFKLTAIEQ